MNKKKTSKKKKKSKKTSEKKKKEKTEKKNNKTEEESKVSPEEEIVKVETKEEIDDSLLYKGIEYIQNNKLESALECFEIFTEEYPENHNGYYYTGYTLMLKGQRSKGRRQLRKAVRKKEDFFPAYFYLGKIEFELNNFEKALDIFNDIIDDFSSEDIKENGFNVYYFIGICYHYLGKLERAEEYFLFAYNFNPQDTTVLYYKALNELALQKYEYAIQTFKELLQIDIHNKLFWDLIKGYSHYYQEKLKEEGLEVKENKD